MTHETSDREPAIASDGGDRCPYESAETIQKWDGDYYQPIARRFYDAAVLDMLTCMGARPGQLVLDAGCGTGVHSARAARLGCQVMSADLSMAMLNAAQEHVDAEETADRVAYCRTDLTSLAFQEESFDHVFSWGVIIHIPGIEQALEELDRVLKPGGSLALYLTNHSSFDLKVERVARRLLGRPPKVYEVSSWGLGFWHDMPGGAMWTSHIDADHLARYLGKRGYMLVRRRAGEFSEVQRFLRGITRRAVLRLNNWIYRTSAFPASLASTQLLVFRKREHETRSAHSRAPYVPAALPSKTSASSRSMTR